MGGGSDAGCIEKQDLIACVMEVCGSVEALAEYWASVNDVRPRCICGGDLARINTIERHCQMEEIPLPENDMDEDMLCINNRYSVVCDLCNTALRTGRTSFVWTCGRGNSTMLHPTAYDVCSRCFMTHACRSVSVAAQLTEFLS